MKPYSIYGTGREAAFIELIDRMLRESHDYISTTMVLELYKKENKNDNISQKLSTEKKLYAAKNAIESCLKKRGLAFEKKKGFENENGIDHRFELFRYPKNIPDDLLEPLKTKTKKLRLKTIDGLIKEAKGLFPASWLTKFQLEAENMANKGKSSPIIEFDSNENLRNLELLPTFYYAIKDKRVLSFTYASYGKQEHTVTFHPHYLKEYNLRWFVLGLAITDDGIQYPCNICALDRIEGEVEEVKSKKYIPSTIDYSTYFDDIVGVTHPQGCEKEKIEIEAKDHYTYMRILTKQLHKSQKVVQPWNGQTGRFSITVTPNYELLGLLMSFEGHIEIFGDYRKTFMQEVNKMYNLYNY